MMPEFLSAEEKQILLTLARQSIEAAVMGKPLPPVDLDRLPEKLREQGVSFVTLSEHGELRGCVGAMEPYEPLAADVQEHAAAAALNDYRFYPVEVDELPHLEIEISRLTPLQSLDYSCADELLEKLRPGIDGVLIRDGGRRATFLPQVWEKIPDPTEFLEHLCQKMGASADLWRRKPLQVFTYQVEEFREA